MVSRKGNEFGKFLDKLYTPEEIVATIKRMRVNMVLPYLGPLSVFIRRCLIKLLTKFYPLVDLKIIYKRGHTISSMLPYKDNFPLKCNSSVVYKIECESCGSSTTYVGKTINTIHKRFYGANRHLHLSTKSTALLDHLAANITPTCEFNTNNIKILDACTGDLMRSPRSSCTGAPVLLAKCSLRPQTAFRQKYTP